MHNIYNLFSWFAELNKTEKTKIYNLQKHTEQKKQWRSRMISGHWKDLNFDLMLK